MDTRGIWGNVYDVEMLCILCTLVHLHLNNQLMGGSY